LVFTAFLLDIQHQRDRVENMSESLIVVVVRLLCPWVRHLIKECIFFLMVRQIVCGSLTRRS